MFSRTNHKCSNHMNIVVKSMRSAGNGPYIRRAGSLDISMSWGTVSPPLKINDKTDEEVSH